MFNGIMNLMNSLEARYNKDILDNTIMNDENEYNILLTIDSMFLAFNGLTIAAGGILNFDEGQITSILVDDNYLQMSETGKRFIIAHELGHIECQMEKFKSGNYTRNIEDEFEADEYAVKQIGLELALEALKEVRNILEEAEANEIYLNEIDTRMENLINKFMVTC